MAGPAAPAMPTPDRSSALKILSMGWLATWYPVVAWRAAAMMTPSRYRSASTVVPCGTGSGAAGCSTGGRAAAGDGNRCGESRRSRSLKLELLYSRNRCCQRSSFIAILVGAGASHPEAGPRDVAQQVGGRRRFRQELPHVCLGAAERLEHEDLLEGAFLEVEDDRVPGGRHDLVAVALQAHSTEVRPRVLRWVVDRLGDLVIGDHAIDRLGLLELVVEALAGTEVVVLEVDHQHTVIVPLEVVLGDVVLDELPLDDPVELAAELPRVLGAVVARRLPPAHHVGHPGLGLLALLEVALGEGEELALVVDRRDRAPGPQSDGAAAREVARDLAEGGHRPVDLEGLLGGVVLGHAGREGHTPDLQVGRDLAHVVVAAV